MKMPISIRKIKCKGCNYWREHIYYTLQDGPFCTDCLEKKYPELFRKQLVHENTSNVMSLKHNATSEMCSDQ